MDSSPERMTPDDVIAVEFETKRRGADPESVQAHLRRVGAAMRSLSEHNSALEAEVADLQAQIEALTAADELDEAELTERLGERASRILTDARTESDAVLAAAEERAGQILAEAEAVFAERSVVADQEAERIRRAKNESADAHRGEAEAEAARLVREAQVVRRRILEDLARRRSAARRQIEQLRAGRERLIASHDVLRRALDEITTELHSSLSEARAAAETAGSSVAETSIEELEAEIETARLAGLLDTGPVPVVHFDVDDVDDVDEAEAVEVDHSVEDLFARMRTSQKRTSPTSRRSRKAESGESSRKRKRKKTARKGRGSTGRASDSPSDPAGVDAEVGAGLEPIVVELRRRLKRVLADEQSSVLSRVRSTRPRSTIPDTDALLGDAREQGDRYWEQATDAMHAAFSLGGGAESELGDAEELRAELDTMIDALRAAVDDALGGDDNTDVDTVVDALRDVYRKVKTTTIGELAESLCRGSHDIGRGRTGVTVTQR